MSQEKLALIVILGTRCSLQYCISKWIETVWLSKEKTNNLGADIIKSKIIDPVFVREVHKAVCNNY